MKELTMGETVASRGGQTLHRGCSNFRDNSNNHSYLEEADMSS